MNFQTQQRTRTQEQPLLWCPGSGLRSRGGDLGGIQGSCPDPTCAEPSGGSITSRRLHFQRPQEKMKKPCFGYPGAGMPPALPHLYSQCGFCLFVFKSSQLSRTVRQSQLPDSREINYLVPEYIKKYILKFCKFGKILQELNNYTWFHRCPRQVNTDTYFKSRQC